MSTALLALIAVFLCILFRLLNVNSHAEKPALFCKDRNFLETVSKISSVVQQPYTPTRLWGFSGHVQSVVHSILGRLKCPWPIGERCFLHLPDGSTLTYDLYQPLNQTFEDDVTLAVCPGIGNTSESVYIRTFVHYAQCHGYRCVVLNHLGALSSVAVTAPRVFTYGHTDDFHYMVCNLVSRYPNTEIVAVGFSLGGNLVTKYFGETDKILPANIIGGISICQGYCAIDGSSYLLNWQNFRRVYLYVITETMKSIILRHRSVLLSENVKKMFGLNERDIVAAATLPELDEAYTRKVHNFKSVNEMYRWSSSKYYLHNIKLPMVFINARDDPIVPENMLEPIREFASNHPKILYVETAHGGHLGFYEGGFIHPNPVTWLDRTVVGLIGSLVYAHSESKLKFSAGVH
ncbi:hypothetical protein ONE63_008413 [Megalurothrips usitatus]|uniref:AB hydrolase-1 domain-containing protein n=1 Tax=Megalurothrips usitatus TaxID=439358 RepID=A0AAV7XL28_9NEOP|nr:hypothetical protein ONE63_008413 [Megalurothrips usitatus]